MKPDPKAWLDHHSRMGSPYHLMLPLFLIECGLSEEDGKRIIKEYIAEVGPTVERNYKISTACEAAIVWALLLSVIIFAPVTVEIKLGLFGLGLLMTGLRLRCG